jgi:hypothetical protein
VRNPKFRAILSVPEHLGHIVFKEMVNYDWRMGEGRKT